MFIILTKLQYFNRSSQFQPNSTTLTKFHNYDQIPQLWPNLNYKTIQDNANHANNTDNTENEENRDNSDNAGGANLGNVRK